MALLKLGALITDISGKIGGQSIAKSRSGLYIKNIGSYKNSRSNLSQMSKNRLVSITTTFRNLSQTEAKAWAELASKFPYFNRVAEKVYYSGFAFYTKLNYNRSLMSLPVLVTAPSESGSTPLVTINLERSGSDIYLVLDEGKSDVAIKLFISRPMSPNDNQIQGHMRLAFVGNSSPFTSGVDITPFIISLYGSLVVGARYWVKVYGMDATTGQPLGTFLTKDILAI